MSRKKNAVISISAGILSIILVYGIYIWQIHQLELQKTVQVVVPNQFIGGGVQIQQEQLQYKAILAGSYENSMFTRIEDIVGLDTAVPLGRNEPILSWKVDRFMLLPASDQSTFQIPKDYILSISNGIRAGDWVRIYISEPNESSRRLFDHEIMVASVKSASNMEIDNAKKNNLYSAVNGDKEQMYASRREANAPIDHINLNLTEQEWLQLDFACKTKQAKLVIAFTSSSIILEP